jgi:hypothetical protein
MPPIFEKPKTLNELSKYELQNLVCYLAGEWDGIGPNPGYSWREFHSDADLGEVPLWFNEWLSSFELENLVSIKYGKRHPMSLCLLKDKSRAEVAIFSYSSDEPAERVGESSYAMGSLSPDLLWPFVEEFLDHNGILEMDFHIFNSELIPKGKLCAFLENEQLHLEPGNKAISSVNDRLKEIYGN